jgi:hypothetical protein
MFRGWRRATVAGNKVEDGNELLQYSIALSKSATCSERYPGACMG